MTTIGEAISRVRNALKAVKEDPFLTDRTIYFAISKYGKSLLKREDNQNRLMKISSIFSTLTYVELMDVDKVEAGCVGITSGCYIKRTKERLPKFFDGLNGPLIRTVSSLDTSVELFRTDPGTYSSMTKVGSFKYNTRKYFWYLNGYLYMPNVQWEAIKVEGVFEDSISGFTCDTTEECRFRNDDQLPFPDYLFGEIEQYVIKELSMLINVPTNGPDDNQNSLR
jgi:hypothetical protein